ncbi:MAG TPA: C45 family peptidase [Armatimonadota bacterium]|nr:C45 family peptidase [Armatimonadota bacterium]
MREINGYRVLTVSGSPAEMGRVHGELLGDVVRRVVQDVVVEGEGRYDLEGLLAGAMVMEGFLPPAIREELHALADAAGVDYRQIVALQLFGDVNRGQLCTGFACFGPATAAGECIAGRNMDYWDHGASEYAAILVHYRPSDGWQFLTCSWAGIINGWTTINERGIVCSNNSAYGGADSLEGLSTCFMVRKVAQFAATVEEGIEIVRTTPRACGTNLLIAGGDPPDAAVVEYDHDQMVVRRARDGYVVADNTFLALGRGDWDADDPPEPSDWARAGVLQGLIRDNYGRVDRSMNFAAAPGVPIRSMNLHSALLFPADRIMYVSMGASPAADHPYHGFRLTPDGVLGLDLRNDSPTEPADPEL